MLRLDPGTSRERNCTIKNTLELWNVLCCLKVKGDLQCLTCQGCNYRKDDVKDWRKPQL